MALEMEEEGMICEIFEFSLGAEKVTKKLKSLLNFVGSDLKTIPQPFPCNYWLSMSLFIEAENATCLVLLSFFHLEH